MGCGTSKSKDKVSDIQIIPNKQTIQDVTNPTDKIPDQKVEPATNPTTKLPDKNSESVGPIPTKKLSDQKSEPEQKLVPDVNNPPESIAHQEIKDPAATEKPHRQQRDRTVTVVPIPQENLQEEEEPHINKPYDQMVLHEEALFNPEGKIDIEFTHNGINIDVKAIHEHSKRLSKNHVERVREDHND